MDGAMSIKSWEASSYCIWQCHAALRSGRNGGEGGGGNDIVDRSQEQKGERKQSQRPGSEL